MSESESAASTHPTATESVTGTARTDRATVLVLIAEDETPIAEALGQMVEDAGYTPVLAAHGKAALDIASLRPPALVITDLMMPYLDGAALITALRREAAARGQLAPPIILMTAATGSRADEAGADALLRKPFDLDEVEALLRHFIEDNQPPLHR